MRFEMWATRLIDPTGMDCLYFNNEGDDIESVDPDNSSGECANSGGDWVNGTLQAAAYNASNGTFGFISSDSSNTYISTGSAPGPQSDGTGCSEGCISAYAQYSNWSPTLFQQIPGYMQGQSAPSSLLRANHSYQGSKEQLCNHQANMAAAESILPGGSVLLGGDYRPSTVLSETAEVAADKSIDAAAESAGVLSWLSHATGLARPLIAQGLKFTGILSNGYTALKGLSALGDEYSSCISR